jgi:hypothetical protein
MLEIAGGIILAMLGLGILNGLLSGLAGSGGGYRAMTGRERAQWERQRVAVMVEERAKDIAFHRRLMSPHYTEEELETVMARYIAENWSKHPEYYTVPEKKSRWREWWG